MYRFYSTGTFCGNSSERPRSWLHRALPPKGGLEGDSREGMPAEMPPGDLLCAASQGGASRACRGWAWGFRVPSSQQTDQPQWTHPACWASGLGAGVGTCPGREDPGRGGSPRSQSWVGEAGPWSSPFSFPASTPALCWPQVCRILLLASCQRRC